MSRTQVILIMFVSALIAFLPLMLVAWMTSGDWSARSVRLEVLALVFPIVLAAKLDLGRIPGLVACFLTYWVIAFALLAWYVRSTNLETRPIKKERREA